MFGYPLQMEVGDKMKFAKTFSPFLWRSVCGRLLDLVLEFVHSELD